MKILKLSQEESAKFTEDSIKFTEEDLYACWQYFPAYFVYILNGEYDLEEARKDLKGLIGSKWDNRVKL